jgi:hypothetical protein
MARGRPFQPGNPGRPVGAKNKRRRAIDAIEAAGLDPFEYLASVVANKRAKPELRIACAKELCEYIEPKLTRQEHVSEEGSADRGFLLIPVKAAK